MFPSTQRTGVSIQAHGVVSVAVRGLRKARVVGVGHVGLKGFGPAELADALGELRRERPWGGGQLRVILPGERCENLVRIRPADEPLEALTDETLRWLEDECAVERADYDVHICPYRFADAQVAVVSLVERGLRSACKEALDSAGIDDVVLVSPLDAMIEAMRSVLSDSLLPGRVLFHVGSYCSLLLIWEGQAPVFFRTITKKLEMEDPQAERREPEGRGAPLSATPTAASMEALVLEFERTLHFYRRSAGKESTPEEVVLCAGGIDVRGLLPLLQAHTGIPTVMATPSANVVLSPENLEPTVLRERWAQFALPAAVAVPRRLDAAVPVAALPSRTARIFSGRRVAAVLALLYAAVLFGWWLHLGSRIGALGSEKAELEQEKTRLERQLDERRASYARRKQYQELAGLLLKMKEQGVFAANLLAAVNEARPPAVQFQSLSLDAQDGVYRLRLEGHLSLTDMRTALLTLERYVDGLRRCQVFDTISVERPILARKSAPHAEEEEEPADSQQLQEQGSEEDAAEPQKEEASPAESGFTFTLTAEASTPWRGRAGR